MINLWAWWRYPFDERHPQAQCVVHGWRLRNQRRIVLMPAMLLGAFLSQGNVMWSAVGFSGVFAVLIWTWVQFPWDLNGDGCFPSCTCGTVDRHLRAHARDMAARKAHLTRYAAQHAKKKQEES